VKAKRRTPEAKADRLAGEDGLGRPRRPRALNWLREVGVSQATHTCPLWAILKGGAALLAALLALSARGSAADGFNELKLMRPRQLAPAKDFSVPGLAGRPIQLRDQVGKVVLLEFWATWSAPCREQLPAIERLHQRYKDRNFTVIGIAIDADGAPAVGPSAKTLGLSFPIGLDSNMTVADLYAVKVLPSTWLLDRADAEDLRRKPALEISPLFAPHIAARQPGTPPAPSCRRGAWQPRGR